ncbi:hypothetical protein C1645_817114 [Glomus cerebriforme]|uniref:PB1 domain-containing protein n=1 Tax=Glomus cerebriforme TaxID=658196 RepID=A0A397TJF9_9GLOM|nr:hypothetical protein C1645_817114 [Glomus cerebriforme]
MPIIKNFLATISVLFWYKPQCRTEIHYKDEDNDRITVTYDDEFQAALENNPPAKFELVIKSIKDERDRLIKNRIVYCKGLCGNVGDYNEVVFKSHDLTLDKLALVHSHPIKLTKTPPPYEIIATLKILPGQSSYLGSFSSGIETQSYGAWGSSFSIESIRYGPINNSSSKSDNTYDNISKNKDLKSENFWKRIRKFFS